MSRTPQRLALRIMSRQAVSAILYFLLVVNKTITEIREKNILYYFKLSCYVNYKSFLSILNE